MTIKDWWTKWWGNPLRNHLLAHLLGGAALLLFTSCAVWNPAVNHSFAGRLLLVALMQGGWELWQVKETKGYPLWSGGLDLATALVGACLTQAGYLAVRALLG